jgi:hypothetical protein
MIVPSKFNGYNKDGTRNLFMGGGGGGGPTQTTSTVQNTNIPDYAKGYVENMLGATQNQLFKTENIAATPATYDDQGNELTKATDAYTKIGGFQEYRPYGGSYDAKGNAILGPDGKPLYDPGKAVAGFQPMQTAAQQGIAGMVSPTAQYDKANWAIEHAGLGADQSAQEAYKYGQEGAKSGALGQQLGIAGGAKYGEMGAQYGTQGANLGIAGGAKYGDMGAGYGSQAAGLAGKALGYGDLSSQIGQMGLEAQDIGRGVTAQSQALANQQAMAGQQYARMATDPRATQALMNPYTQNVLDVQNKELERQAGIASQGRGAAAVRAGAFGGGRQAIENAEAQRNLETMKNANQAQALNQAYQQAQAQQQFGANLNLQGLAGAQQGLGTALSGGQLGLSGIGTALQGQQGALAGVGAANQAYQTGIQGAGMGLQGVNTQLAGTAQGMQGAQVGLQGVDRQLAGTAQGMQGAQIGLQGVAGAQAGYGLLGQQGMNLTNALGQQQQQELGIYGAQNAAGAQQQALEQAKINQSMLDYANAQQYPLMQLGTMSNMLRGLPMQASTTNQYAASPSPLSQAVGTVGAGASIYNAMAPRGAAGGVPSEFKYAKGGITSVPRYDMGGEVESQLENMDEKGLQAQARESSSPSIRKMAQRLLRERQMSKQPQSPDAANVQYQAAQPQMPSYKPGGIVAFTTGGGANEEGGEAEAKTMDTSGKTMEDRLAMPPSSAPSGIMAAAPVTQVPASAAAPSPDVVQEAIRQRNLASAQANRPTAELLKEIQAERDALGVGENVGRQEFRAQQMAERANMKDEQERQRHMRLAEFFASWGSTPGPVLVAGMNALKQSIPNIISDEKDAKKARKEADKIIYDIDEATRLEKLGMIDKATALKEKAASHAEDYNKYLLTFQSQRESDKRALEVANIGLEGQKYVADSHAAAQRGANAQRAEEVKMRNIENSLEISRRRLADVERDIESTRNKPPKGTPLAKAMESVNRYNNILEKNDGDASKVDAYIKKDAEQAKAIVDRFEDSSKRRLKDARDQVQTYENIFTTQGRGSKPGATTPANKADPYDIMDILKNEPSASTASANAPAKTSANAPAAAPAAAPATNSLASKIDKETNELGAGTRKAYSPDVQEYFDKLKAERKAKEAAYLKQQQQQMLTPLR